MFLNTEFWKKLQERLLLKYSHRAEQKYYLKANYYILMDAKKILPFIILLVIAPIGAVAQQPFAPSEKITPPIPPEEGEVLLEIELRDAATKVLITNAHVEISANGIETIRYAGENGIVDLYARPGSYRITLKIDRISTEGKDYWAQTTIDLQRDKKEIVSALPVGSVRGEVLKSGKIIPNAKVGFSCSGSYGELKDVQTDEFGVFEGKYLPIGNCRISGRADNLVGNKSVQIEQGKLKEIKIDLSGEVEQSRGVYYIILIIVLAVLGFFAYKLKFEKQPPQKIIKRIIVQKIVSTKGISVTARMRDLMETLSESEAQVVQFLIDNKGSATQAKIMHSTGIPKASLSRYIDKLEQKKIIETTKIGKVNKVKLSKWFLRGEK